MNNELSDRTRFFEEGAGDTLLVDYPLNKNSIVFELGGYTGCWANKINSKYGCRLFVFEPVTSFYDQLVNSLKNSGNVQIFNFGVLNRNEKLSITIQSDGSTFCTTDGPKQEAEIKKIDDVMKFLNVDHVDLIQINIEGSEYDLLDYMIANGFVSAFTHIQVQFHRSVSDAEKRREVIVQGLSKTHIRLFNYEFTFEAWKLR